MACNCKSVNGVLNELKGLETNPFKKTLNFIKKLIIFSILSVLVVAAKPFITLYVIISIFVSGNVKIPFMQNVEEKYKDGKEL